MSQTYNLGKVAITPRGAYSSTAQYTPLDILSYNGSSYLVLQNCMGVTPPNATYYMVVASKGDTGSAGASPTIAAGTVTMTPAGTSASVTNVGTNVNASFNFTLPSGNMIYTGTGVTGTSTDPTVFSGSGVANAGVGDIYFNTSIVAFYQCTFGGAANTAMWVFLTCAVPDGSITTSKVADSSITTNKIADGAVGEDELSSGAVRLSKLASDVTDVLDYKANVDGAYEQMTVGNAEQIVSTVGITDESPYLFRTSGGSVDIGDRENEKIVGGTIAWNQRIQDGNFPNTDKWGAVSSSSLSASNNVLTVHKDSGTAIVGGVYIGNLYRESSVVGHKYLFTVTVLSEIGNQISLFPTGTSSEGNSGYRQYLNKTKMYWLWDCQVSKPITGEIRGYTGGGVTSVIDFTLENYMCFDLTFMFGSAIADYVYTLETSTSGSGVAWLQNHGFFTRPYYSRNTGTLLSVNTSAHKTVGFNLLNTFLGYKSSPDNVTFNTANAVRVISGMEYEFNHGAVSNATTWRHAVVCYDLNGAKIPDSGLITAGSGGMEYYLSGRYYVNGSNGTRTADKFTPNFDGFVIPFIIGGDASDSTTVQNPCVHLVWDGEKDGDYEAYELNTYALDSSLTLRGIPKLDTNNNLYYDGDTYESDGTVTREWGVRAYQGGDATDGSTMITDGTNTVYKLATPTTEMADAFTNPQIVSDWGTEEYVDYGYYQGTRDVEVPVGHTTLYSANLRAKLEMQPNSPDSSGDYLVRQTNGLNEYVSVSSNSIISGLSARCPSCPADTDGNFVLKAVVSDGSVTYSWVSV